MRSPKQKPARQQGLWFGDAVEPSLIVGLLLGSRNFLRS
jgi:hypothetical protein